MNNRFCNERKIFAHLEVLIIFIFYNSGISKEIYTILKTHRNIKLSLKIYQLLMDISNYIKVINDYAYLAEGRFFYGIHQDGAQLIQGSFARDREHGNAWTY